jgi:hypothetical protein
MGPGKAAFDAGLPRAYKNPMKALFIFSGLFLSLVASAAGQPPGRRAPEAPQTKLICKTGAETRSPAQPLRLYFNYNVPFVFEPEDPTVPFGRQVVVLAGKPVMQLFFEKAGEAAGENGEYLQPMQCAFPKRALHANEPSQVQILLSPAKPHWLSQTIGQRPGPAQLSFERAVMAPAGDWGFASQYDKVFSIELDDTRSFVTSHLPKVIR